MSETLPDYPEPAATLAILDRFNGNRIFIPATNHLPRVTRATGERRPLTLEGSAVKAAEKLVDHRVKIEQTITIPTKFARGVIYLMYRCDGQTITPTQELGTQPFTHKPMPSSWVDLDNTTVAFENIRAAQDSLFYADIYTVQSIRDRQVQAKLLASDR